MKTSIQSRLEEEGRLLQAEYERLLYEDELKDIAWLVRQPEGRRFLWRLVGACGVFTQRYHGNQMDALEKGRYLVGADLYREISLAEPKIHAQMHEDYAAKVREIRERARNNVKGEAEND